MTAVTKTLLVWLLCSGAHAAPGSLRHDGLNKKSNLLQVDGPGDYNAGYGHEHHETDRLTCGLTEQVGSETDKYEDCPANCPYFAQNRKDDLHCTFLCVPAAECGRWNPNKPIPDTIKSSKTCRGPKVAFCTEAMLDGSDTCQNCQNGFALHDGQCYFSYWNCVVGVGLLVVVFLTIGIVWFVDLCCREATNTETVKDTCKWRDNSRIFAPADVEGRRVSWPLSTNMCDPANDVGGPGMTLHFSFQRFFIIWPICVAMVWVVLACMHNELFILGTRKFGTPRHNCILVAWGYETQQRLMWTKVLFLAITYVGSFVGFLLFSVQQLRNYQWMDQEQKTIKDFTLQVKGLPAIIGSYSGIEKALQKAIQAQGKQNVVGVSVAWNFADDEEKVQYACLKDQEKRAIEQTGVQPPTLEDAPDPTENMPALRAWMYNKEKGLLGPDEPPLEEDEIKPMLESLTTSDCAFVVFDTEAQKNEAWKELRDSGVEFDATPFGCEKITLKIEEITNEPANVNWQNFGDSDPMTMMCRGLKGIFTVYVPALLIWFFGFYVPYACALYYFNYDSGAELPGYYSIIFTIVVCGGNATMYVVCDICCDIIGFRYKDTKQKVYMLMYLVACMINVFLDMVVTYYTAMKIMVGQDFRTYDGTRLADIDTFTAQFETYAMQRSLGGNTYAYAWPSTFFLCFVLEPFVTIWIPLAIGKVVVRTHPEIIGSCAEAYLMAFEFDMGRYADILLNAFLGIMIFWFPGGYIWTLFFAMGFSHTFIYCFDHWRVITVIPYVKIVICEVDWWAQAVMCGLCGMIMGCLVFKSNCETYAGYCHQDMALISRCFAAGAVHFVVHFLLLVFFVPMMGMPDAADEDDGITYAEIAAGEPRTWFSMNPVHCLRSKYIHGDKPSCLICSFGKEHLLEPNAKIGCYYDKDAPVTEEEFDMRKSLSNIFGKEAP